MNEWEKAVSSLANNLKKSSQNLQTKMTHAPTQHISLEDLHQEKGDDIVVNISEIMNINNFDEDKNITMEGTCISFTLKKIIFSRKPRDDFDDELRNYLTDTESLFVKYDKKCKITLENYRMILSGKQIHLQAIGDDLKLFYKKASKRTNDVMYLVGCELNDKYSNKSNKFMKKNPFVKDHLVIFKRGNILCSYLGDMKLSLIKHLTVTNDQMRCTNTSTDSYISKIRFIYEIVKL
jgi:hypothetical protein